MLQKRGRLIRTQVPSLKTRMNRALGMRIRQPLRYCCFGGVSTILLRKKTYGRRTLLCTPVLLEIKPELVVTRLKITFVIGNLAKAMIWMRLFPDVHVYWPRCKKLWNR
ncbi:uncharacterized protein LOC141877397 [Acropora palmata]|uniref:uncharacterized protein LOC141877397 n=1 Tax=Acropora palmata TaxID=6131 RepID=UPI003DA0B421